MAGADTDEPSTTMVPSSEMRSSLPTWLHQAEQLTKAPSTSPSVSDEPSTSMFPSASEIPSSLPTWLQQQQLTTPSTSPTVSNAPSTSGMPSKAPSLDPSRIPSRFPSGGPSKYPVASGFPSRGVDDEEPTFTPTVTDAPVGGKPVAASSPTKATGNRSLRPSKHPTTLDDDDDDAPTTTGGTSNPSRPRRPSAFPTITFLPSASPSAYPTKGPLICYALPPRRRSKGTTPSNHRPTSPPTSQRPSAAVLPSAPPPSIEPPPAAPSYHPSTNIPDDAPSERPSTKPTTLLPTSLSVPPTSASSAPTTTTRRPTFSLSSMSSSSRPSQSNKPTSFPTPYPSVQPTTLPPTVTAFPTSEPSISAAPSITDSPSSSVQPTDCLELGRACKVYGLSWITGSCCPGVDSNGVGDGVCTRSIFDVNTYTCFACAHVHQSCSGDSDCCDDDYLLMCVDGFCCRSKPLAPCFTDADCCGNGVRCIQHQCVEGLWPTVSPLPLDF